MAPTPLQQRRTHNTLLFQKLLNLRDGASPFTLVLDTLEQSGAPVIREFARRAKISKTKIIYISYTTLQRKTPFEIDVFISARSKTLSVLRAEIISHLPSPGPVPTTPNGTRYLLILHPLNPLAAAHQDHLTPFLSSLITSPQISLLATYHTDIPLSSQTNTNAYAPHPLQTLTHLSTAILLTSSLSHVLAAKRARDKSLQESVFGLPERREGVLFGLNSSTRSSQSTQGSPAVGIAGDERGLVVQMELRRKSGRGVIESFVLLPPLLSSHKTPTSSLSQILLLDEHPSYAPPALFTSSGNANKNHQEGGEDEGTFSLNLTDKQKKDREGVVLPYFDAQRMDGGGVGDGGRILYEMSEVDREDFDDEEDEI